MLQTACNRVIRWACRVRRWWRHRPQSGGHSPPALGPHTVGLAFDKCALAFWDQCGVGRTDASAESERGENSGSLPWENQGVRRGRAILCDTHAVLQCVFAARETRPLTCPGHTLWSPSAGWAPRACPLLAHTCTQTPKETGRKRRQWLALRGTQEAHSTCTGMPTQANVHVAHSRAVKRVHGRVKEVLVCTPRRSRGAPSLALLVMTVRRCSFRPAGRGGQKHARQRGPKEGWGQAPAAGQPSRAHAVAALPSPQRSSTARARGAECAPRRRRASF